MQEVEKANATGKQPVVFVHGLWLLPNSWDRWRELFEEAGYVPHAIANSSFKHEHKNEGVTEVLELEGRGHSLDHRPRLARGLRQGARVRQAFV